MVKKKVFKKTTVQQSYIIIIINSIIIFLRMILPYAEENLEFVFIFQNL